jgi:uncharacterized protein DUF3606
VQANWRADSHEHELLFPDVALCCTKLAPAIWPPHFRGMIVAHPTTNFGEGDIMVRIRSRSNPVMRTVDIEDAANCSFWTRELGVNIADLKRAVREVGARPEEVRHYLAIRHHRQVEREVILS